jgi:L-cysteine/cystine lyase
MIARGERGFLKFSKKISMTAEHSPTEYSPTEYSPALADLTQALTQTEIAQNLRQYRQQFPALTNKLYFNYGGQGPLPLVARDAILQAYDTVQQLGPFSGKALDWIFAEVAQTRAALAASLGVAPATLTLTESVSVGCNIPLWGLDWQPGDRLVTTDCEHPGIVATLQQLQRRFGIEVVTLPLLAHQQDPLPLIIEAIRQPRT